MRTPRKYAAGFCGKIKVMGKHSRKGNCHKSSHSDPKIHGSDIAKIVIPAAAFSASITGTSGAFVTFSANLSSVVPQLRVIPEIVGSTATPILIGSSNIDAGPVFTVGLSQTTSPLLLTVYINSANAASPAVPQILVGGVLAANITLYIRVSDC